MSERFLIASTKEGKTKSGRKVAHLHSTDTRLQFPVLILFDMSLLSTIGIDPNTLTPAGVIRRYWAYYEESSKLTSKGNPYKNVLYLERIDQPVTSASNSTVINELREIKNLLQYIAHLLKGQDSTVHLSPITTPIRPAPSHARNSSPPPDPPPATDPALLDDPPMPNDDFASVDISDAPPPAAPDTELDPHEARTKFYALTGEAITLGAEIQQVNALIDVASKESFAAALVQLENLLERITTK